MPSRVKAISALLIIAAIAGSPYLCGQDGAAPIYAGPEVKVNGIKSIAHEVLPGEMIEIPANNLVILHPGDDQVYLEPLSMAVYRGHLIDLDHGTTSITTKNSLALTVHQYRVTPIAPFSKYEVTWNGTGGRVRVYEGEVSIDGCEKKLKVPKDNIAELGKECKMGAYLNTSGGLWEKAMIPESIAAPALAPVICYYKCNPCDSGQQTTEVKGCR